MKVKLINEDRYIGRIISLDELSKDLVTTPKQIKMGKEYKLLPKFGIIKRIDSNSYEVQEEGRKNLIVEDSEIVQKGICILDVKDEREG